MKTAILKLFICLHPFLMYPVASCEELITYRKKILNN